MQTGNICTCNVTNNTSNNNVLIVLAPYISNKYFTGHRITYVHVFSHCTHSGKVKKMKVQIMLAGSYLLACNYIINVFFIESAFLSNFLSNGFSKMFTAISV